MPELTRLAVFDRKGKKVELPGKAGCREITA